MAVSCNVVKSSQGTIVREDNGEISKLYENALVRLENETEALGLWSVARSEDYRLMTQKDSSNSSVDDVLAYLDNIGEGIGGFRLTEQEISNVKMLLNETPFNTFTELYEGLSELFKPKGVAEINEKRLLDSGLYTLKEIQELDLVQINDFINKLGVESTVIHYNAKSDKTISNIKDMSKPKNELGMHPFVTEQQVVEYALEHGLESLDDSPYSFVSENARNGVNEGVKVFRTKSSLKIETVKERLNETLSEEYARIEREAKENGTWLKAPNGKDSNLTERQWVKVRSRSFLNWFGDWLGILENNGKKTLSLRQLNKLSNEYEQGNRVFKRLSQREQSGFARIGKTGIEAALLLDRVQKTGEQGLEEKLEQEETLRRYAKEKGVWHDNYVKERGEYDAEGLEAKVWYNRDGNNVVKAIIGLGQTPQQFLDRISIHNYLFPETALKVVGFSETEFGELQFIVEQPLFKFDRGATFEEVKAHMKKLGFEHLEDNDYINHDTLVEDLHEGNAVIDSETGRIAIIDPIITLNTANSGYGGDRVVGTNRYDYDDVSKVVDENGEPLIVYHGSKENFTVFNEEQTNNSGYGGYYQGVSFFTDDKKVAENFAGKNGKVYEVFLNIKNPYYRDGGFVSPTTKLEYEDDSNDGIIINNADTGAGIATEYLIDTEEFSPNQIKSATDNVGTFSSESNDIRFQQGRLNPYQKEASKIHWEVYNLGRKLTSYELNNYNKRLKAISDWIGDETWHLRETRNGGYYVAGYQNRGVTFPDYYSPYANGIFRFQIVGERGIRKLETISGQTLISDALSVAREMESSNKLALKIKLATGWERGNDGKWRYEILDGKTKINDVSEISLDKDRDDLGKNIGINKVSDFIDNDTLFKAYPEIKDMEVITFDENSELRNIQPLYLMALVGDKIFINKQALEYANDTRTEAMLRHEIQHRIQDIEGFSRGSSIGRESAEIQHRLYALRNGYETFDSLGEREKGYVSILDRVSRRQFGKSLVENPSDFTNKEIGELSFIAYENQIGEVEARNVENRINLTQEQRNNTLLEDTERVPRSEQLLLMRKSISDMGDISFETKLMLNDEIDKVSFQIVGEKGAKRLDDFKSQTINMFNLDNANKIQSKELFSEMMDFSLNKLPENLREQVVKHFNNEKIDESALKEIESNEEYRKAFNSYGLWKSDLNEWDGLSNEDKNDYTRSLTGWEQGKDGKWRMEVSDIEYIGEPFKDMSYNQSDDVVGDGVYKTKLSDLVKGDEVFKSYPELDNIDVVVINNDSKVKDNIRDISFDLLYLNGKIIINEEKFRGNKQSENLYQQRQRVRGLLIHEIQHIIQNDEGFAKGTNVLAEEGRLRKAVGEFKAAGFERDKISAEGLNVLETAFYTRLSKGESLEDITKNIKDYSDGAKVLYSLSAGEVEARNADLRSNLSEVERASKSIERTEDIPRGIQTTFKDLFDYVNGSSLQIAGERGVTLLDLQEQSTPRLDNLSVAREMESAGKSALEIKLATSWEKGADGKWRYEIDYGKSKITDLSALKYKDKLKGVGEGLSVKKLSDYIDNEELFTAYPEAKNIDVIVFDENSKINLVSKDFYLAYQGNYIFINKNNLENARNIRIEEGIRHEIQHYIQSVEKFDRGSSPEGEAIKIQSRIYALRNGYEKIGELTDWRKRYIEDIERISKRELGKSLVENLGDFSEGEIITLSNYVYQDLAGEVEARNVQNRYLNLTKEERAKTLLSETEDVVRESQVILFDELNRLESSNAVGNASELTLSVIDRLKQNGLSDNVFIHNTNELLDKLKELGYDNAVLNEGVSNNENIQPIPNGFVVTENGKKNVYLNSDNLNPNTAIHEFGHLYLEALKQSNRDIYNAGVSLISKNKAEAKEYIDYVNRTQPDLKQGSEKWNEEVLAQVIGDNGARLIDRSQKGNSIKNWLSNFWNSIKEMLGLTDYTASQVSNMTLREFGEVVSLDMMKGRDLGFGLSLDGGINLQTMEVEAMRAEALSMSKDDFIDRYSGAEFRDGHSAPGDSGHEGTLEERMDEGDDFNLSEVVQGFHTQPSDYFGSMGARWYGYNNSYGTQSMNTIRRVSAEIKNQIEEFGEIKDMPTVTIYRAVPIDVNIDRMINGDWVSLSEDYAVLHGESRFGEGEYKVIKEEVPANDVWWDGNDLAEWGYDDGGVITREEAGKLWEEYRATPINSLATGSNTRLQTSGEPLVGTNSNFNFPKDSSVKYYKTSTGQEIPYKTYSKDSRNTYSDNLADDTDSVNDFALVERMFTESKGLDFTAGVKINSPDDIAWMFRALEDEAVEHSFAVYVMEDGGYVVQHLGMGGVASTIVDGRLMVGNAVRMKATSMYFVHNHPSGSLQASEADISVYRNLKKSLEGTDITLGDGIIINLRSGKYVAFNSSGLNSAIDALGNQNQEQVDVNVLSFSKQIFAENYNPEKISSPNDVAKVLSTKKFGVSDKTELMVLNQRNEVIGKFVLPELNQYSKILELMTQYGGVNAILYGNNLSNDTYEEYQGKLSKVGFNLLDGLIIESNNLRSLEYYSVMPFNHSEDINEPDVRLQILGERGAEALDKFDNSVNRMDNLEVARQMESSNKSALEIRLATGWERGADNLWRYEILDGKDLISNVNDIELNEKHGDFENVSFKKVSDFIDNEELFNAYPSIKDFAVLVFDSNSLISSVYSDVNMALTRDMIIVNKDNVLNNLEGKLSSGLRHEVQHYIQDVEGFGRGTNVITEYNFIKGLLSIVKNGDRGIEILSSNDKKNLSIIDNISINKLGRSFVKEPYSITETDLFFLAENYYTNFSGEVEARNVQNRIDMTTEQRRNTLLSETENIARDNQIIETIGRGRVQSFISLRQLNETNEYGSNVSKIKLSELTDNDNTSNVDLVVFDDNSRLKINNADFDVLITDNAIFVDKNKIKNGNARILGESWIKKIGDYSEIIRGVNEGFKKGERDKGNNLVNGEEILRTLSNNDNSIRLSRYEKLEELGGVSEGTTEQSLGEDRGGDKIAISLKLPQTIQSITEQVSDLSYSERQNIFNHKLNDVAEVSKDEIKEGLQELDFDLREQVANGLNRQAELNKQVEDEIAPFEVEVEPTVSFSKAELGIGLEDKVNSFKAVPKMRTGFNGEITRDNLDTFTTLNNTLLSGIDRNSFLVDYNFLTGISENVWKSNIEDVKATLKSVEVNLIKDNIDLIGLSDLVYNRDGVLELLSGLNEVIAKPTKQNIFNFAALKDELIGIETVDNFFTKDLPLVYKDKTIVRYDGKETLDNLLEKQGMIKIADGLYHKVNLGNLSEAVETLKEGIYNKFLKGEFELPSEYLTVDKAYELENKSAVIESITNYANSRDVGVELNNKELYSLIQLNFNHLPIERANVVNVVPSNAEYLKTGFVSDFYNYILNEKLSDSALYNKVLKNFKITDNDIVWQGTTEPIIDGIRFEQELRDYASLKREPGMLSSLINRDVQGSATNEDLQALNYPDTVKDGLDNYQRIKYSENGEVLLSEFTPDNWVRVGNELYRKVADLVEGSVFEGVKIVSDPTYFDTNLNFETNLAQIIKTVENVANKDITNSFDNIDVKTFVKDNLRSPSRINEQSIKQALDNGIVIEPISNEVKREYDSCSV